ncbi:hypothetical protein DP43_5475 [Burkholderia pseudomallei]|nr:hypothetical protein DP43_5475 [Burkholderia pseudomallei]
MIQVRWRLARRYKSAQGESIHYFDFVRFAQSANGARANRARRRPSAREQRLDRHGRRAETHAWRAPRAARRRAGSRRARTRIPLRHPIRDSESRQENA